MRQKKVSANSNSAENQPLPKPRYRLNPHEDLPDTFERPIGKRLTIPDQTMSVKEILKRFSRGQRIPDQMVGYYDEENDPLELEGVNVETLDLSEKYDLLEKARQRHRDLRSRYNKEQKEQYEQFLINKGKEAAAKEFSTTAAAPSA